MSDEEADESEVLAVALLRVPEWEAPEDLDVRFLEDGALVFLDIEFDAEPEELVEELLQTVGEPATLHDDDRGLFFLPDFAEPEDAKTYEAVVAAVGDGGRWITEDDAPADAGGAEMMQAIFDQAFQAMGISDPSGFMQAMQSGDPEAQKLAQIQMQSRMEQLMRGASEPEPPPPSKPGDPTKR